ncbi:hypothetical protein OUZ56_031333 [Daphnia magna]|uniref:Uncharacterized protein n=1 Tax=Daphnia magna TaxID=35525 RepID=A0ABQ9ZTY1_9CRUS|nr:hypothetical protein OUZ56_031333 [Daphnia magna]
MRHREWPIYKSLAPSRRTNNTRFLLGRLGSKGNEDQLGFQTNLKSKKENFRKAGLCFHASLNDGSKMDAIPPSNALIHLE